jgi:quercetin dioxygenase-like cupin family protein
MKNWRGLNERFFRRQVIVKHFPASHFLNVENPDPKGFHRVEILNQSDRFKDLGGIFAVLPPGREVPYHFHQNRESVIIALAGEAVEIIEGKEVIFGQGDDICIPPGEKHGLANRSDKEFRYIEFFTYPPALADFVEVKPS